MFLDITLTRNPKLLEVAKNLHQSGDILPDTYVLDLDTILQNARAMADVAKQEQVELFYMPKQFGRNPLISKKISETAISKAVVVDYKEALLLMKHQLPLGNVGHLVQIPNTLLEKIIAYGTDYITVFSMEKLQQIVDVAKRLQKKQRVLLKIIEPTDTIYEGQYGGFHLSQLEEVVTYLSQQSYVELGGLTSFPCFLFNQVDDIVPTKNIQTLQKAKEFLEEKGITNLAINMPSATSTYTIPKIKALNGTQGEPGHALTGTTPLHQVTSLIERPAMVYVSEISHCLDNHAYFYGGGYYRRGHFEHVIVYEPFRVVRDTLMPFDCESIDYYLKTEKEHAVGSTVLAAFRTQIFVTRSDVAVVSGIQTDNPKLEGIFDSLGNQIRR
ncbi:YhfX family PLP-dependent enzyme [Granulicatella sp. zg-ZJ]|uniref:alanine racemase n=1 Tax=Granulicatella sp. zg-ZJ TaxID=2678504 RepID=UPI0013D18F0D|nr:YhfX family PLP-dependent enzyme [Granulicatella sp. zg-ZJ]